MRVHVSLKIYSFGYDFKNYIINTAFFYKISSKLIITTFKVLFFTMNKKMYRPLISSDWHFIFQFYDFRKCNFTLSRISFSEYWQKPDENLTVPSKTFHFFLIFIHYLNQKSCFEIGPLSQRCGHRNVFRRCHRSPHRPVQHASPKRKTQLAIFQGWKLPKKWQNRPFQDSLRATTTSTSKTLSNDTSTRWQLQGQYFREERLSHKIWLHFP